MLFKLTAIFAMLWSRCANELIRRVSKDGEVTLFAGTTRGYSIFSDIRVACCVLPLTLPPVFRSIAPSGCISAPVFERVNASSIYANGRSWSDI